MTTTRLSVLGRLLADETRSEILCALMDGRSHTGSELARHLGVAHSTVSEHLAKLWDAGFVAVSPAGRHRYYSLANAEVAQLLEAIGASPLVTPVPLPRAPAALHYARTCYNHLAGELAVNICDSMLALGHVQPFEDKLTLSASGEAFLVDLGVDEGDFRKKRQASVRPCLDWTQRRPHLAGVAANAMLTTPIDRGCLRTDSTARAIRVTRKGESDLYSFFGLDRRTVTAN